LYPLKIVHLYRAQSCRIGRSGNHHGMPTAWNETNAEHIGTHSQHTHKHKHW
jgi:hypothetical protein